MEDKIIPLLLFLMGLSCLGLLVVLIMTIATGGAW